MSKPIPTIDELGQACADLEILEKLASAAREKNPHFADTVDKKAEGVRRWLEGWAERLDIDGRPVEPAGGR